MSVTLKRSGGQASIRESAVQESSDQKVQALDAVAEGAAAPAGAHPENSDTRTRKKIT